MPAGFTVPASMASGVTKSGIATNLAPKVVGDVAALGASKLGLAGLVKGLGAVAPQLLAVAGVLDALGFFDKGMEATPMTPEEAAEYEATSRLALAQSGMQEGGEGAYEMLMDAVEQARKAGLSDEELKIEEIDKGLRSPVFPFLEYPTLEDLEAGGGGGGGDTAASSEAASAASSQTDTGTGDWIYDADAGLFRESGGIETFIPVPGTYTDGQTISYGDAAEIFGEWGKNSTTNTATIPTSTSTATTTTGSGADDSSLNLPTVLYLPDFGGTSTTGTLTLPTFTAGTGTTGTGTTGTGTTGTGTTGTGTTGTGAANLGGTGGGLSTGTGTGDGSGTGSGTGTGDGAGDGSGTGDGVGDGTGDGTGREQGEAQELADLLGGGGMRGVATEQAGVADISMLYDPSLSLAENMARILGKKKNAQADTVDSALMYGGGIVQPTDLNDELLRIIGGR